MARVQRNKSVITQFRFRLAPEALSKIDQLQSLTDQERVISIKTQGCSAIIKYDLMETGLDQLQQMLIKLDVPPAISPWQKLRIALKVFTDQNVRDHETHQHQCCGKAPKQR